MGIFSRETLIPYKSKVMEELKNDRGIKNPSAEQVLSHLFGDYGAESQYTVRRCKDVKSNVIQRFNALWVYPLYFVFIAPVKWLVTGYTGVESESRAWKVLEFLLGNLR